MIIGEVTKSCLTLCSPIDYTVHGILQARILEWVAFPFSRRSSKPRDQTQVSCIASGFFLPAEPQGKPKNIGVGSLSLLQLIFLTQESKSGLLIVDSLPTELSGMPTFQNLRLSPFSLVIPNPFQCFSDGYQCFKFKLKISRHLFNRIILGNIQ